MCHLFCKNFAWLACSKLSCYHVQVLGPKRTAHETNGILCVGLLQQQLATCNLQLATASPFPLELTGGVTFVVTVTHSQQSPSAVSSQQSTPFRCAAVAVVVAVAILVVFVALNLQIKRNELHDAACHHFATTSNSFLYSYSHFGRYEFVLNSMHYAQQPP